MQQATLRTKFQSTEKKEWCWGQAQYDAFVAVQCKLAVVEVKDQDKPLRMPSKFGIFKTSKTWNTIAMRSAEAKWAKLVWFWLFLVMLPCFGQQC